MKRILSTLLSRKAVLVTALAFSSLGLNAQTNVYDDVISTSPNHTSLTAAINAAGLQSALQNPMATLTVFVPDNDAFDDLASDLGTDIPGLLALPNLSDILLYHVLGITANAASITNGDIVTPLNTANTIKLTKTSGGMVYANHALVDAPDLNASNGVVHSIDAVILSNETVVDVAIDNGFSSLTTAVVTAELLPALTDPFAEYTVFAPNNTAFDDLAADLGTDINGLLALPNLGDILLYHVLDAETLSTDLNNGDIVTPLNTANTVKLTVTSGGDVYANHAMVALADVGADNGVVHVIDAVVLPNETVVDVAIDNGFTTLTTAVVTAELLPALTDPFAELTVFAPDNTAFDNLAAALGTDLNGILALPNLEDVLLYHVVGSEVMSGDLTNGPVATLLTEDVQVDLSTGVMINSSNVTLADVGSDNGVVHVIDAVLLPTALASVENLDSIEMEIFPNPASEILTVQTKDASFDMIKIFDMKGNVVIEQAIDSDQTTLNVQSLTEGQYVIKVEGTSATLSKSLLITPGK